LADRSGGRGNHCHLTMNQIGRQRYHGTDTRNGHQTPAHVIVPDDSQHAAMQDSE